MADPHATATPTADSMEPVKRSRLVWTRDLHMRFEAAVEKAGGIDVAVPKTVLEVRVFQSPKEPLPEL